MVGWGNQRDATEMENQVTDEMFGETQTNMVKMIAGLDTVLRVFLTDSLFLFVSASFSVTVFFSLFFKGHICPLSSCSVLLTRKQ